MNDEKKWSVERNFRRLVMILCVVSLGFGMIPAFLVGHWLFFLGCVGIFWGLLWTGYMMARRLEWIHQKWIWRP
jgi:1,4-dihydroxy-2-naphthoate octaprenyltransferase